MKHIGWQLHKYSDGTKTCGGSFGGDISMETANRLIKVFLDVEVLPSGTVVFVDKKTGERVRLSFTIDAKETDKGKEAIKQHKAEQQKRNEEEEVRRAKIMSALEDMTIEQLEELVMQKRVCS